MPTIYKAFKKDETSVVTSVAEPKQKPTAEEPKFNCIPEPEPKLRISYVCSMGLQRSQLDGIQTEINRYLKKIKFHFLQNV
jgi:hypothetical protein